jgi:maltose-binding protein MalE
MIDRTAKLHAPLYLLLLLLLLVSCQPTNEPTTNRAGRLLLWHSWTDAEAETLTGLLQKFNEIHPNVTVISQQVPLESLLREYEQAARLGLGPDLFIGPGEWLAPLADQGLILDLGPFEPRTDDYLSRAVQTLTYNEKLYGLPLALRPTALYYNTQLVDKPAVNLDEWLAQAAAGQFVAMDINFLPAYWGIQAFGGRLLDDTGRVALDEGGFANWLRWQQNAQTAPGMVLSRDSAGLKELFYSGKVAYYTGSPDDLAEVHAALGEDNVAVTVLPEGPVGPSGPLLFVEAFYFNPASRPHQTEQALLLTTFMTNPTQSTSLMRGINRVPANRTVPVDARLHPAVAGFAAQARTSVAVENLPQQSVIVSRADDLSRAVLAGAVDVTEGTVALVNEVNEAFGFPVKTTPVVTCQAEGFLRIWHPWNGRLAEAVAEIVADYQAVCPDLQVVVTEVGEAQLYASYTSTTIDNSLPDLVLGPSTWLLPFVQAQSVQSISSFMNSDIRQRFRPSALSTLEYQSELYGLPFWLELDTLYFNNEQISDPPSTLTDLLQLAEESGAALPTTFIQAYWGATAHDSRLFTPEFRLALVESGFVDWLTWLETANAVPNMRLSDDPAALQAAFSEGEVAMWVGPASALGVLEQEVGLDKLRLARLPSGPGGEGSPWLTSAAFFITGSIAEEQRNLALGFIDFATNAASQTNLMESYRLVPVNVTVGLENAPVISGLLRNVSIAFVPPNVPELTAVLTQGDQVYRSILAGLSTPVQAACLFTTNVDQANGFSVTPNDLPELCRD